MASFSLMIFFGDPEDGDCPGNYRRESMSQKNSRENKARRRMKEMPDDLRWTPVLHSCGHFLAWGEQSRMLTERMRLLTMGISYQPCPACGSGSGVAGDPLADGEIRYLLHNQVWYRMCPPQWEPEARHNAMVAKAVTGENPVARWETCPECGSGHPYGT